MVSGSSFHFHQSPFLRPEHQAFSLRLAGGLAQDGQFSPLGELVLRREAHGRVYGQIGGGLFQQRAPLGKGAVADVLALPFQQVVSVQHHGGFFQQLFRHGLASDAGLQRVEG